MFADVGSVGPFKLVKNQDIEILFGYEVDRSTTPLGGVAAVRVVSDEVRNFYEDNFGYLIVSVENETQNCRNYSLEQNYPNPFNPSTKIKFTIPTPPVSSPLLKGRTKEGFVTLKIYDILGNEVATLVNEELSPGEYPSSVLSRIPPRGQAVSNIPASGIYFYQLRAGSHLFRQEKWS